MAGGPLDALERFKTLEERIGKILETVQELRRERRILKQDLSEADRQIASLQKEIEVLRKERVLVRGRVERLIENISQLNEKQVV